MNKKIIMIVVSICIIFLIFVWRLKVTKENNSILVEKNVDNTITAEYDEESNMYYLKNSEGEILYTSVQEEDIEIQKDFYERNPEYRANPPSQENPIDE